MKNHCLEQGPVNYDFWVKYGPPPFFLNMIQAKNGFYIVLMIEKNQE